MNSSQILPPFRPLLKSPSQILLKTALQIGNEDWKRGQEENQPRQYSEASPQVGVRYLWQIYLMSYIKGKAVEGLGTL